MTRTEIEDKLVAIVRNEKIVPDDKLSLDTPLANAGIDSLDALTILFAIEEEFHISIPDDRARSMKTFGDMVDSIEMLCYSRGGYGGGRLDRRKKAHRELHDSLRRRSDQTR
jgi:acyl carrier protein